MLKVETKRLKSSVATLKKVTSGARPRAILKQLRLSCGHLEATDLETYVSLNVGAEGDGDYLLPVETPLGGLLGADTTIRSSEARQTILESGSCKLEAVTADPSEWPDATAPSAGRLVASLEAGCLLDCLNKVSLSAARDQGRYAINGVYFVNVHDRLDMVATNGHCLSKIQVKDCLREDGDFDGGRIIPIKSAKLLQHLLKRCKGMVDIRLTSREVIFVHSDFRLNCVKIEGIFPKYEQVIPDWKETTITINVKEALDAFKAFVFPKDCADCVLDLVADDNKLSITSPALNLTLSITALTPCAVKWSMTPGYFKDMLSVHSDRTIDIEYISEVRPIVVRARGLIQVIMPVTGKKKK
jgi:DNA polymerase-3 subunit beta